MSKYMSNVQSSSIILKLDGHMSNANTDPNYSKINETFQNLQKTEKSSELKWDNIHLEILDNKVCILKQDFLNIEYLQKNQKNEIFEEITENFETINENIENINKNNASNGT